MKDGIIQQAAPPLEVYRRPANQFVAGFIGSPSMNFLEFVFDGAALVRSNTAVRLELPEAQRCMLRAAGQSRITLGVRPEHLILQPREVSEFGAIGFRIRRVSTPRQRNPSRSRRRHLPRDRPGPSRGGRFSGRAPSVPDRYGARSLLPRRHRRELELGATMQRRLTLACCPCPAATAAQRENERNCVPLSDLSGEPLGPFPGHILVP